MYGLNELKESIAVTENSVECPVVGCKCVVRRQRKNTPRPKCPRHDILISPSTFSYLKETDNLLWNDNSDTALLNAIKKVKRESRIQENNSEDAVTWNVFRFLEKNNLTSRFINYFFNIVDFNLRIIFWSYSPEEEDIWQYLNKGREEFELHPARGSEPDVIIIGDQNIFFIEVKLSSGNTTNPSNLAVEKKYTAGGNGWWSKVFKKDFATVAITNKKYELARFWLIGSWIGHTQNKKFHLINLTLNRKSKNIEKQFRELIIEDETKLFKRITWEDIFSFIQTIEIDEEKQSKNLMLSFFRNKTLGYFNGKLKKAFDL